MLLRFRREPSPQGEQLVLIGRKVRRWEWPIRIEKIREATTENPGDRRKG